MVSVGPGASNSDLSTVIQRDGDRTCVVVTGEIDMTTADTFDHALTAAVTQPAAWIIVDLAAVRFMDSSGINVLVHAYNRCAASGKTLTVINCQPAIRRVMEITGVYDLLTGPAPEAGR